MLEAERDHLRRNLQEDDHWMGTTYKVEWNDPKPQSKEFTSFRDALRFSRTKIGSVLSRAQMYKR